MCDCECNETCKIDIYLDIKNCLYKKCLFGKLVLACENEILNRTETSLVDKNNYLIYTISLVNIRLSLSVVTFLYIILLLHKILDKK